MDPGELLIDIDNVRHMKMKIKDAMPLLKQKQSKIKIWVSDMLCIIYSRTDLVSGPLWASSCEEQEGMPNLSTRISLVSFSVSTLRLETLPSNMYRSTSIRLCSV